MYVSDEGLDWLDKHEAARISGYNARTLTNKAMRSEVRAEKRGTLKQWYFWRADIEALRQHVEPIQFAQQ